MSSSSIAKSINKYVSDNSDSILKEAESKGVGPDIGEAMMIAEDIMYTSLAMWMPQALYTVDYAVDTEQISDNSFVVSVDFYNIARNSLNNDGSGIKNILELYEKGIRDVGQNTPYGIWHGSRIRGVKYKEGDGVFADQILQWAATQCVKKFGEKTTYKYKHRFSH